MRAMRLITIVALILLASTGHARRMDDTAMHPGASIGLLPLEEAIQLSITALRKEQLLRAEEFQLTVRRGEQQWTLWFEFQPLVHGGDVTVFVGGRKDVRVFPGL